MARPTKRTPEREARLLEALRASSTRKNACAYAGIDQSTLENWLQRYSDFSEAVKTAEASTQLRFEAIVTHAAQTGTWQAAAWWLERRRNADYGRALVPSDGQDLPPIRVTVSFDRVDEPVEQPRILSLRSHAEDGTSTETA